MSNRVLAHRAVRGSSGYHASPCALLSKLVVLLVLHAPAGWAQQTPAISIAEALRDADGDRIPDRIGDTVDVVGIAISDPLVLGPEASLIQVQDSTGGVALFTRDTAQLKDLAGGDRIRVRGAVGQYRGAEQLTIDRVEREGGAAIPAPRDVLASDLLGERYAGRLVRVSGELVASAGEGRITAELRDRSGRIPVYIPSWFLDDPTFTQRLLRGGDAQVVGIAGQYDVERPYDSGYQLTPRNQQDFSLPFLPPYRLIALTLLVGAALMLWMLRQRSRRRAAELAARAEAVAAEKRIRDILESISDGFIAFDRAWRFVYVNTQATKIFGKPADELLGLNAWEAFPQLIGASFREEYERAMADGAPAEFEAKSTISGDWFQVHIYPGADLLSVYYHDITSQKAAEERLRESEQRFRALTENSLDTVTVLATDGTILYKSASVVRELGWTPEELQGRSVFDFIHPDDQPEVLARLQRIIEKAEPTPKAVQLRFRHKNGSWRVLESLVQNHLDEPAVSGIVANSRDITERRAAEDALRESEQRFRLMVEAVKDYAIILLDPDGRVVEWNTGAERVKGYNEQEILGCHILVFYPEEDRHRGNPERALEIARSEGDHEDEGWRVRRDGSRFWASVVITALRKETGELVGFAEITRDLTERHEREKWLRRQGQMVQLLQQVAVAANQAVTVEEALQETIQHVCTEAGFEIGHAYLRAGSGSDELVSAGLWHLNSRGALLAFQQATESRRVNRGSGLPGQVLASGEIRWIADLTAGGEFLRREAAFQAGLRAGISFPVLAGEEIVAVLEFFSEEEISPDPILLDTLANVGTQLGRVFERTRAEEDVLRAKEEAERANLAKSEFLSRMSHELRTPMNAILGFAQILEIEGQMEDDRESVDQILRAGRHLLALIDEVLDISRIESGGMTLSLEPVSLANVLRETQEMVRGIATEHRVTLTVTGCEHHHPQADQQRLKQVLLNLLSNAIKYNREGGSVTITCEERPERRLRIAVADTGPGIAPEKLQRLFTPFDRLEAELQGMAEGTGLGLSLSKGLVEAMGGTVGVQSTIGKGSTFWLDLPLAAAPAPETGLSDADAREPAAEPSHIECTLLLIEDNIANVQLIERVLSQRPGMRLFAAMQGRLGLDLAEQHRPDLILLDVHLPDIPGDQVLEQLRRKSHLRDIPVVAISADATKRQTRRLLDAGARDYLTKPFDVRRLLEVLDDVFAAKASAG
jgi:PAS domain S-box-containing protein